jgi:hypothetical protein
MEKKRFVYWKDGDRGGMRRRELIKKLRRWAVFFMSGNMIDGLVKTHLGFQAAKTTS